ncbi:MAG: twin-arginine translocase TatA/TatE family subunit [Persicimonas sp.]
MFGGLGTTELIVILVLAFMIFGVGKLPQVAKMLGSGVNNFRRGLSGEDEDEDDDGKPDEKKEPALLEEDKTAEAAPADKKRVAEHSETW